ncbi:GNAT family N-acetyltransferase [Spongiibacter nanhainus]|uniref:GNAT family N-acetyltransferase n=1 Tax=Spongiibacter nanhainus TaxID=2794344 RepID=A0A7T4R205_9GAMM|nr:GNAT family N-acetyltransferase [Spongiibacter nanhainus]QQD18915.1 GNAT family N-acetyltransferase [Spongiibacter nanhainus]
MSEIEYLGFDALEPRAFLALLNRAKVRRHLVQHQQFDEPAAVQWVSEKLSIDSMPGCRLRAVCTDGELAGWCGIQPDADGYELAVVLDADYWGIGLKVYKTMMEWAQEFGHHFVNIHLLASRPEYRFLRKMATSVTRSEWQGEVFVSYRIAVLQADLNATAKPHESDSP